MRRIIRNMSVQLGSHLNDLLIYNLSSNMISRITASRTLCIQLHIWRKKLPSYVQSRSFCAQRSDLTYVKHASARIIDIDTDASHEHLAYLLKLIELKTPASLTTAGKSAGSFYSEAWHKWRNTQHEKELHVSGNVWSLSFF